MDLLLLNVIGAAGVASAVVAAIMAHGLSRKIAGLPARKRGLRRSG